MRTIAGSMLLVASCGGVSMDRPGPYDSGAAATVDAGITTAANEPTRSIDAGLPLRTDGATRCAPRNATYQVTVRHMLGECGASVEGSPITRVDDAVPLIYPPTCFGSCDHSPENCTTIITMVCPGAGGLTTTQETVTWSLDGAKAIGTESVTIPLPNGAEGCAAYYAVTYDRVGG